MKRKLSDSILDKKIATLSGWKLLQKRSVLSKEFIFDKHVDGLIFIARITVHAQVQNHHPDLEYSYKKVTVTLTTHEAKGITELDIEFAKKIQKLYKL
jgi:4a-hydroxytetrahydrobiopterin dehydratase